MAAGHGSTRTSRGAIRGDEAAVGTRNGINMIDAENGFEFHHVGVACTDIPAEVTRLAAMGYAPEGVEFEDWRQGVRGLFMGGQSPRLELLEPLGKTHS